jgi:diguanylate cyclase (GGDEF)-like protein
MAPEPPLRAPPDDAGNAADVLQVVADAAEKPAPDPTPPPPPSAPADGDAEITEALQALEALMVKRIKLEQRRDQLTGLPNERALEEQLDEHIRADRDLWAAFVEVDKFKSINDAFGYQNADVLLCEVAKVLREMSTHFTGIKTQAFRPHGDEFFLVGAHETPNEHRNDVLERLLNLLREKLKEIRKDVVSAPGEAPTHMTCTVSIGWLVLADVVGPISTRSIRDCLERAMEEAKRERDRVVRYSTEIRRRRFISLRADCKHCGTKLNVDIPVELAKTERSFRCPHCHDEVPRPPTPVERPGVPPVEI